MNEETPEWLALQDVLVKIEARFAAAMEVWESENLYGQESGEPRGIVNTPGLVFPWLPPAGWRKNLDEGS